MPRTKEKRSRNANGNGTIRKKTVMKNGKEYAYWEARYTEGYDPGTGKQIQRSITGKTQKEVAQKLKAATAAIDAGTYTTPNKMTVGQWLDIWTADYLGGVKPRTVESYLCQIKNHIRPELGAIRLDALNPHTVQRFYNRLGEGKNGEPGLSPKSIKIVHGVLHKAMEQAVALGYLQSNPADKCTLPKVVRKELNPLDEDAITRFMEAIKGHRFELVFLVTLFTGMRQGEVLGLAWDCVDFHSGKILIKQQIQRAADGTGEYRLLSTKNGKGRTITPAPFVMQLLQEQKKRQVEWRLQAGCAWEETGLVFTNELGGHLFPQAVRRGFKKVAASIGCADTRFHDLRHSYAVAAIKSGDDIKTVQGNLGHATAAFTLDIYGHVTEQMKRESAERMENFIRGVSAG